MLALPFYYLVHLLQINVRFHSFFLGFCLSSFPFLDIKNSLERREKERIIIALHLELTLKHSDISLDFSSEMTASSVRACQ